MLDLVKSTNSFDDESLMHEELCSLLLLPATVTITIWKASVCYFGHAVVEISVGGYTNGIRRNST